MFLVVRETPGIDQASHVTIAIIKGRSWSSNDRFSRQSCSELVETSG